MPIITTLVCHLGEITARKDGGKFIGIQGIRTISAVVLQFAASLRPHADPIALIAGIRLLPARHQPAATCSHDARRGVDCRRRRDSLTGSGTRDQCSADCRWVRAPSETLAV